MIKLLIVTALLALATRARADTVLLKNGDSLHGTLTETQASFILLKLPETEGEAIRRLSPDQIKTLSFSDQEAPLEQQALLRAKFIPLLSEADAKRLPAYLQHLLSTGQARTALTYAKRWHPKNTYPDLDSLYRNLLIQSSLDANLPQEALIHAQSWLALEPAPTEHPLPWQTQAQHYLDTDRVQEALWTALTPIAHANEQTPASLDPLHKIAAAAYQKLGYPEHAAAHNTPNSIPIPQTPLHLTPQ